MIAEVEKGFYAVSFAGGQVDPATGDFVFGVSEGYLIEGGKVTRPCRGATLIGNCLEALAAIDAVGNDFEMKTGFCGKGGQKVPVGTGQGHVRIRAMTVGGTAGLTELSARRGGVEAALGAGAGDAEAYASEETRARGARARRRGREPHRGDPARGRRAGLDRRPGRLRLRHRPLRAGRRRDRRPRRRGGAGRRRGRVRRAAAARRRRRRSTASAIPRSASGRPTAWPSWRWRWSAPRWRRLAGRRGRAGRLRRQRRPGRDRLLDRRRRGVRGLERLRLPAGAGRGRRRAGRPASASASPAAPPASTPRRSARRAPSAPSSMIGARKPASRSCPVVLDPTVAASFAGLIGCDPGRRRGAARPLALRRPARRGGRQRGAGPARRRPRPRRPRLGALRRRGRAAPPHRADRGRAPADLPLRHLHGPSRRRRLDRQRRARRLPLASPRSRPPT